MKISTCSFVVALLLTPSIVLAHGGGDHVMGVVKAIDGQSLTVETSEHKDVQITFDDKTKFERDGAESSSRELHSGDRVVVHCAKVSDGEVRRAVMVKLAANSKAGADAGTQKTESQKPR